MFPAGAERKLHNKVISASAEASDDTTREHETQLNAVISLGKAMFVADQRWGVIFGDSKGKNSLIPLKKKK